MPVTPFHYPLTKIISRPNSKIALSLPALIVGSFVPDLECPFIYYVFGGAQDRLVLHSLIGGLTVGTLIAVALTALIYAPIVTAVFPVDKTKVRGKCRFSALLVLSCLVGCLSHVLLDVANHAENPVFWPFLSASQTPSPIVPLIGGDTVASLIVHGSMVILFVGLFYNKRKGFWEHLLVG